MIGLRIRLAEVRAQIAEAAGRTGRDPASVRIVAVTKTLQADAVAAAIGAGILDIGENYVQEASTKRGQVGDGAWHLIGGLQRNKVRLAVSTFDVIQTVDSTAMAELLDREAGRAGRILQVLVQVNVAGEAAKRGAAPDEVEGLASLVRSRAALELAGLMMIGPPTPLPEGARPHFRRLRELRDRVEERLRVELPHLSMGMSNDFPIAVEEGATVVRLGRALFGPRGASTWREGS